MAPLTHVDQQHGRKAMEESITTATRVKRAFKAGRPRVSDAEIISLEHAILDARLVFIKIRAALLEAGIRTASEDLRVGLAILKEPKRRVGVFPLSYDLVGLNDDLVKLQKLAEREELKALGVVLSLYDRESCKVDTWVQPWLVTGVSKDAARALAFAEVISAQGGEISF